MMETKNNISGFAKGNGKVVHIIVDDIFTLCDRKREMLPEDKMTVKDVSCAKCKRGAIYKNLISEFPEHIQKPVMGKKIGQPKKQAAEKQKSEETEKQKKTNLSDQSEAEKADATAHENMKKNEPVPPAASSKTTEETIGDVHEKLPQDIKQEYPINNSKKPKDREGIDKNQLLMLANMLSSIKGQFMATMKTNFTYRITHVVSEQTFFDGVKQEVVSQVLLLLNNIEEIWDGQGIPSPEFLSKTRRIFGEAHKLAGYNYPESLKRKADEEKQKTNEVEKQHRKTDKQISTDQTDEKITKLPCRRKQKDKIVKLPCRRKQKDDQASYSKLPKRRSNTIFGKRKGTPPYVVMKAINGIEKKKSEIIELLQNEFGFSKSEANSNFSYAVRVIRLCNANVTIKLSRKNIDDIYFMEKI